MPGIPDGVLSSNFDANCLDSVRAHFTDEARGTTSYGDIKLFLVGNGKTGKTQIARWLCGEAFESQWDSTHGVRITITPRPGSIAAELGLQIWDFGGQDLYHSTHALFLSGGAIVMPVWALEQEDGMQADKHGYASRNQKLAYWLTVARHQFRAENPVLIAQTKIAGLAPSRQRLPAEAEAVLDNFSEEHFVCRLHLDSLTREQEGTLRGALTDAIKWLRAPGRLGMPSIGIGRLRVLRELERMRAEDAKRQSAQRQHRTLSLVEFEAICAQGDDISSSEELLKFLDRIGAAIYRSGYFDDHIVLDFDWLLQGIYTVFARKNVYPDIQRHSGRFTLGDLARLAWQDRSREEQKLLLDMMLSCGICFRHRRYWGAIEDRTEYVAPDLLPERSEYAELLAAHWEDDRPTESIVFHYAFLHDGMIRTLMSDIGQLAGKAAIYWRGGLYGFETRTGSRFIIEQKMVGWTGSIHLRTQKGQASDLAAQLAARVERAQEHMSLRPERVEGLCPATPRPQAAALTFAHEKPEWFVSYAWGDLTPEGREREAVVDRLCEAAKARGRIILRDKHVLGVGGSISQFMTRIGTGDRVFVVLSDKYLHSPFCMFELCEICRTRKQEGAEFLRRVRVYALPDARIFADHDWIDWAVHWKNQHDALEAKAREHGVILLGEAGYARLRQMKRFPNEVAEILATIANIVQPRSFEELERYGFD